MTHSHPTQSVTLSITAPAETATQRIDKFLADNLDDDGQSLSRSRIKALILDKRLLEDGRTLADPSSTVKPLCRYALELPPPVDATPKAENIPLDVLYEDAHIIVLNKPAGMVVHPAPGSLTGTLVNALIAHCGESLTGIGGVMRPGIVHRLDKDTSGVMMAAKPDIAHHTLTSMFAAHDLDRRYHALVWGTGVERDGMVDAPLGRSNHDRKKQAVNPRGRHAITHWRVMRTLPPFGSLVECTLETGRTHQIRVHMAHIGHPVIGDPLYGRAPRAGQMPDTRARTGLAQMRAFDRQALHAAHLGFDHPVTGEPLAFSTPIPPDMATLQTLMEDTVAMRAKGL